MTYFTSMKRALGRVFYGWWIVAAAWIQFLICGGTAFYGFTAFFDPIRNEFSWSAAQVAFAFSLRSIEGGVMGPIIGFLIDRIGVRKIIISGMALTGLGMMLLSYTNSLLTFYGIFLLFSLGMSAGLTNSQYVAAANWFSKKRSWAMAILSTGFGFSGFIGPVLVWLIAQYGWRQAALIMAVVIWLVGIPLGLVFRHRPETYGYLPDGEAKKIESPAVEAKDTMPTTQALPAPAAGFTARQAIATRTFWMLVLFGLLTGFAQSAIMVHEMPYLTSIGISREIAGWVLLGITGSSIIGRLGFGWLGDRCDKRYLLAIGAGLQCIGVLIFANIGSPWMILPFLLFYGPGYASQIPLYPAIRADYFGLKQFATIGGLMSLGWTVCGILAPVLAGWVYDTWGSYRPIWLAYAIVTAIGIPMVLSIKRLAK
jgi:OFA family oxalate/formate antiporter-like MFS transporter